MIGVAIYFIGVMAGFGLGVLFRDYQRAELEFRQYVAGFRQRVSDSR